MERTRRDGSPKEKEIKMNSFRIYVAAASAMACLVAPAGAASGSSIAGSNLGNLPAVQHSGGITNLPAVQKGSVQLSTGGKNITGLPAVQHGAGGGGGTGHDRSKSSTRR